jgi:hypothetical protein
MASKILFDGTILRSAANHSRGAGLTAPPVCRSVRTCSALIILVLAASLALQLRRILADEHASHHGRGSSGDMEGEIGSRGEMEGEHRRSNASFYPTLMNLPSLTPEQRAQIDQIAQSRMNDGTALMSRGVDLLSNSTCPAVTGCRCSSSWGR